MTEVRELAEKILAKLREPISGTIEEMQRNELEEIESLLSETMNERSKFYEKPSPWYTNQINEAYEQAAKVAEEEFAGSYPDETTGKIIAEAIRKLKDQ